MLQFEMRKRKVNTILFLLRQTEQRAHNVVFLFINLSDCLKKLACFSNFIKHLQSYNSNNLDT